MANLTAKAPGTTVTCPDCGDHVDPYFHCCALAKHDAPFAPAARTNEDRSDADQAALATWISEHSDPEQ